ncbi:MAG TPA: polysaccharide deacetylase family protein [Symbiobacteriaceae bacterium]|nr:polysaccharide deacetylase family protein [Symbiobacteriaceae bacterium]
MRAWAGGALLTVTVLLSGCAVAPVAAPKLPAAITEAPAPPPAKAEQPVEPAKPPEPPAPQVKWLVSGHWGPVYTEDAAGKEQKAAVLTFDDGPSEEYTPLVLDALKAEGVKAIFFVNGHAGQHPDLIRRIVAEGHILANHTLNHENLTTLSAAEQRSQIAGVNEVLQQITGQKPYWFRAPFGAFDDDTLAILDELGMQLLNWSHGSGDWMEVRDGYKDPGLLTSDVLAEQPRNANMTALHAGSVILFHDTLRHTAEALPGIIQGLKAKGYTFVLPEPSRS